MRRNVEIFNSFLSLIAHNSMKMKHLIKSTSGSGFNESPFSFLILCYVLPFLSFSFLTIAAAQNINVSSVCWVSCLDDDVIFNKSNSSLRQHVQRLNRAQTVSHEKPKSRPNGKIYEKPTVANFNENSFITVTDSISIRFKFFVYSLPPSLSTLVDMLKHKHTHKHIHTYWHSNTYTFD